MFKLLKKKASAPVNELSETALRPTLEIQELNQINQLNKKSI